LHCLRNFGNVYVLKTFLFLLCVYGYTVVFIIIIIIILLPCSSSQLVYHFQYRLFSLLFLLLTSTIDIHLRSHYVGREFFGQARLASVYIVRIPLPRYVKLLLDIIVKEGKKKDSNDDTFCSRFLTANDSCCSIVRPRGEGRKDARHG
jgi:hypothetical protein